MEAAAILVALVCALVLTIAIWTLVSAVILRAAVAMCNKWISALAPSPPLPEPSFRKATQIALLSIVANIVMQLTLGSAIREVAKAAGGGADAALTAAFENAPTIQLISVAVSYLALAGLTKNLLPTTFPRALLVAFCHLVVSLFVAACIAGMVFVFMMIIGK